MFDIRRPKDPTRLAAFACGVLYLLTFVSSIPAAILLGAAQVDPTFTLTGIPDSAVRLSAVLEFINVLTCIGTAVAIFSVVKRQHESLALGFVATRLLEGATIVVGIVMLLTLATLREAGLASEGTVATLVAIRFWSILLGPGMASWNALMFGTLLFRSRLVPRAIPALGIIGAPFFIAFVAATMLGITGPGTIWHGLAVAPFFIWELAIGLWLTFKGFSRTAPIVSAAITSAPSSMAVAAKAGAA